jgi:hypothetical protein
VHVLSLATPNFDVLSQAHGPTTTPTTSKLSPTMSENVPPPSSTTVSGTNGDVPGQPYYEKTRRHLQELIRKKALISNNLANLEEQIYKKETEYLEETPAGNIITGFEGYTKGTNTGLGGRKRGNAVEGNRVFSRSGGVGVFGNAVCFAF